MKAAERNRVEKLATVGAAWATGLRREVGEPWMVWASRAQAAEPQAFADARRRLVWALRVEARRSGLPADEVDA